MTMLYTVYLQYRVIVDAPDKYSAYRKVYRQMREEPGMYLNKVEAGTGEKKRRSVLSQLFFG